MKQRLMALVSHRYTGYFLRAMVIGILLFGVVNIEQRKNTLSNEGCEFYWNTFHGVENFEGKHLVNSSEREWLIEEARNKYEYEN